jgi:hypothetical protein
MSLITEVLAVRSLNKDLRDILVPIETVRAIEKIHEYLRTGTDSNGWHRVDWRSRGGARPGPGSSSGSNHTQPHYRGFGGRQHGNIVHAGQTSIQMSINRSNTSSSAPRTAPSKYVSRFKSSSDKIEDTILNTLILGKLNKFSNVNYDEIKAFLCQILDSGETDFLKDFMKLVFQKATTEEIFCPLYARLISELSEKYSFLLGEMIELYKEYMNIFEEISEEECTNYDDLLKRNCAKKYRLGYSQFLAELVKYDVLDKDLLTKTITTIVEKVPKTATSTDFSKIGEEYADCLLKIVTAMYDGKSDDIRYICSMLPEMVASKIYSFTQKSTENKLTMKARFALLDTYERIQKNTSKKL